MVEQNAYLCVTKTNTLQDPTNTDCSSSNIAALDMIFKGFISKLHMYSNYCSKV